jgi:hypothetical protein
VHRIGVLGEQRDQRVPRLVVRRLALVLVAHDEALALGAQQHLVLGALEVDPAHLLRVAAGGEQRGLVHQVLEIGAHEAGRAARDHRQVDVVGQVHALGVHLQDRDAAAQVRPRHDHAAVEAAGAQQRRVQHVRPVGRGDQDHALVALEAVHLDEELVQRLLPLVVSAAEPRAPVATHRVDFVDEDDAGGVLLALEEEIAHPRGTDAHEHLHEIRAGDGEERHARLAGDRAREQRLAGTGRPDQQHALGNATAQPRELLGLAQEGDDLLELDLRLLHARHVLEGDAVLILREQARARLAEAHRLAAARLHLSDEEDPEADEEEQREPHDEDLPPEAAFGLRPGLDRLHLGTETREQTLGDGGCIGVELIAIRELAGDLVLLDHHGLHLARLDPLEEVAVGERRDRLLPLPQHRDEQEDHHQDDDPEGHVPVELLVHSPSRTGSITRRSHPKGATSGRARPARSVDAAESRGDAPTVGTRTEIP